MFQSYHKYLEIILERGKKSKVYRKYQETGLQLAEILEDRKHKALYIKLAKEHDEQKLLQIAKNVAEKKDVKNKGAYFMWALFDGARPKSANLQAKDGGSAHSAGSGRAGSPQAGGRRKHG